MSHEDETLFIDLISCLAFSFFFYLELGLLTVEVAVSCVFLTDRKYADSISQNSLLLLKSLDILKKKGKYICLS